MRNLQKGFTLIELMIVVAIIAILAAIALPAYQDYLIRSQVSEGSTLSSGAKTAVAEYFSNKGVLPADNDEAGLAAAADIKGKYVSEVEVSSTGTIEATFAGAAVNEKIKNGVLVFSPITNAGSIEWTCKAASGIDNKYLPTSCRS